jgi:Domain of unknown function (DUF4465)/Secretion system C-terminal sorting domain
MKRFITFLLLLCSAGLVSAQIADFEAFNLAPDSYLNGSDGSGGFSNGGIFLPNQFEDVWQTWSGWAISNYTDNTTPGYGNQYSAITGGGAEGSEHYALTFVNGKSVMVLNTNGAPQMVTSIGITNSTYAYFSMRDGDSFAKKFGGLTGNDPDYFLLTIKAYLNGYLLEDSVNFYLADFRFSDNSQDYIVADWAVVNPEALGAADSLIFTLSSSDNGAFGMNTPAYFCIDNVAIVDPQVNTKDVYAKTNFTIAPNPAVESFQLINIASEADCYIYDQNGSLIYKTIVTEGSRVDVSGFPEGLYLVKVVGEKFVQTELLGVF